jgi:hypothetical protein
MQKTWGPLPANCRAVQLRHGRFAPSIRQLRAPAGAVDAPRPLRGGLRDWAASANTMPAAVLVLPHLVQVRAPRDENRSHWSTPHAGHHVTNALAPDRGSSGAAQAVAPPGGGTPRAHDTPHGPGTAVDANAAGQTRSLEVACSLARASPVGSEARHGPHPGRTDVRPGVTRVCNLSCLSCRRRYRSGWRFCCTQRPKVAHVCASDWSVAICKPLLWGISWMHNTFVGASCSGWPIKFDL